MSTDSTHPFARAGYPGPYTYIGATEKVHRIPGGALSGADLCQPGGCCDVCGTGFRYGATFRDSRGVEFTTGCDCAVKSLRDYDSEMAEIARNAKREIIRANKAAARADARARADEARAEREAAVVEAYQALDLDALSAIAHPLKWAEEKGLSWADAVRWHADNGNFRRAHDLAHEGAAMLASGDFRPVRVLPTVDATKSAHIGAVKERRVFEATILAAIAFETDYGWQYIIKMATTDGDLLAWKSSSPWGIVDEPEDLQVGAAVRFKATIKGHGSDSYNDNAPITWVIRCKAV